MQKKRTEPTVFINPVPLVMVSCGDERGRSSIITVGWGGGLCADPPFVGIAVRRDRYSHGIITDAGEYAVNLPSRELLAAVDYCGTISGRDRDKFADTGLNPQPAGELDWTPLIHECPVNLECRVEEVLRLGTHDFFVARVVASHVRETWTDDRGRIRAPSEELLAYCTGTYLSMGEELGSRGRSFGPGA